MSVSHARLWRRRQVRMGAVGALSFMLVLGGISNAAAYTPKPAPSAGQYKSLNTLAGSANKQVTTVVVQLADDPVTVQAANATSELTPTQKQVIKGTALEGASPDAARDPDPQLRRPGARHVPDRLQRREDPHRPGQARRHPRAAGQVVKAFTPSPCSRPTTSTASRSSAPRPSGTASLACTARASRSPSSTPASTTRTPTSGAPARWPPMTQRSRPTRSRPTPRCSAPMRRA